MPRLHCRSKGRATIGGLRVVAGPGATAVHTSWLFPARGAFTLSSVIIAALVCVAPAQAQPSTRVVPGEEFVALAVSEGVDAHGWRIEGDVDLRPHGHVDHLVRCQDCTFEGSIVAPDVVFERPVDLSGLQLEGALDIHASTFRDVLLLQRTEERLSWIDGAVDVRLAAFERQLGLDDITFRDSVDGRALTVRDGASITEVTFADDALLSRARFRGPTDFSGATFFGPVSFARASFAGPASFRQSTFHERPNFRRAAFYGPLDVALADLKRGAALDSAGFDDDTNFRFISSGGRMSFDRAYVKASLDLDEAYFRDGLSMAGLTASGTVRMTNALIDIDDELRFDSVRVQGLLMDLETVDRISGRYNRMQALRALERTATLEGDLSRANGALYALRALSSQDYPPFTRAADFLIFRGAAGYLVQPLHPLLLLLLVVGVAASVRLLRRRELQRRRWRMVFCEHPTVLRCIGESWRQVAASLSIGGSEQTRCAIRGLPAERWIYRMIVAALVVAIGNSSEAIRELFAALRG